MLLFGMKRMAGCMIADKMHHIAGMTCMRACQHNMPSGPAARRGMANNRAWTGCRRQGGKGKLGSFKVGNNPFSMGLGLRDSKACA